MPSFLDKIKGLLSLPKRVSQQFYQDIASLPAALKSNVSTISNEPIRSRLTDLSSFLSGVSNINPLLGGLGVNKFRNRPAYDVTRPSNKREATLQDTGETAYKFLLAQPFGFKSLLKNAGYGSLFGVGSQAFENVKNKRPVTENMGRSAISGAKNAPLFAFSNAATERALQALGRFAPSVLKLSQPAIDKSYQTIGRMIADKTGFTKEAAKQIGTAIAKNTAREVVETPLDTLLTSILSVQANPNEKGFRKQYSEEFLPNLAGNLLAGSVFGSAKAVGAGIKGGKTTTTPEVPLKKVQPKVEPSKIVAEIEKPQRPLKEKQSTPLKEALEKRRKTLGTPLFDTKVDYEANFLAKKYGFKPEFVRQKLNEGYDRFQIQRAMVLATDPERKTEVRSPEGFVTAALRTKNFTQEPVKFADTRKQVDPTTGKEVTTSKVKPEPSFKDQAIAKEKAIKPKLDKTKPEVTAMIKAGDYTAKDFNKAPEIIETKVRQAKTKKDVQSLLGDTMRFVADVDTRVKKAGGTWEKQIVKALETGKKTKYSAKVKDLFDRIRKYSIDSGVDVGKIEDYWFRQSPEKIKDTIKNGLKPDTLGDALLKPAFGFERKYKLKDYDKSGRAVLAYVIEATKNIGINKVDKDFIGAIQDSHVEAKAGKTPDIVTKFEKVAEKHGIKQERIKAEQPFKNDLDRIVRKSTEGVNIFVHKAGKEFHSKFLLPIEKNITEFSRKTELIFKSDKLTDVQKESNIIGLERIHKKIMADEFASNMKKYKPEDEYTKWLINEVNNEYFLKNENKALDVVMGKIRGGFAKGALGWNLLSPTLNIFEVGRIASTISVKSTAKATKRVFKGENKMEYYGVKDVDFIEKGTVGKILKKMGIFTLFSKTEKIKNNFAVIAYEEEGLKKGFKLGSKELDGYVRKQFDKYAIGFGKGQDPIYFKNPVVKTMGQFLQYPLRDSKIFWDEGVVKGLKGLKSGDIKQADFLFKRTLSYAVQIAAIGVLKGNIRIVKDEEGKKKLTASGLKYGVQSAISPYGLIANLFEGKAGGPIIQAVTKYISYLKEKEETDSDVGFFGQSKKYELEFAKKELKNIVAMGLIPGDIQLRRRVYETLKIQKEGSKRTLTGNVAYAAPTDKVEIARSLLFGPSTTREASEYFRALKANEFPSLSEKESAVFRTLPKSKQKMYYDTKKAIDKSKADKKKLLSGVTEKRSLKDILTGKKPEEIDLKTALFEDADIKTVKGRKEALRTIEKLREEDQPEEMIKEAIKASGISKDDYEYYTTASKDSDDRESDLADEIENMAEKDKLVYLSSLRKAVGGKKILANTNVDYLYDKGLISKDEKKLLNAIKYDEKDGKYYFDRDFGGGGISTSKKLTLINKANSLVKTLMSPYTKKFTKGRAVSAILSKNRQQKGYNELSKTLSQKRRKALYG